MILSNQTRIFILVMQAFLSVIAASYAVKEGIPYIGIGPWPWWQFALRWPWSLAIKFGGIAHPLLVEMLFFVAYALIIFAALHCLLSGTMFAPGRRENVS